MADPNAEDQDLDLEEEELENQQEPEPEGESDEEGGDDTSPAPESGDDEEDSQPRYRRSRTTKDFIIERKNKQIERLKKKEEPEEEGSGDDEDGEDLTPEVQKGIDRTVKKALSPFQEQRAKELDNQELQDVLSEYPEAKSLEKNIRKQMEWYPEVPVETLALSVLAKEERKRRATDKAKGEAAAYSTAGTSRRPKEERGLPDFSKMSDAEFDEWDRSNQT